MAVSLNGVFCFPWPDTGQIQNYEYHESECVADGKTSIAMSIDKLQEFVAASSGGSDIPPGSIVITQTEYDALVASSSPLVLSVADGAAISALITIVWVTAWSFRAMRSTLNTDSSD